MLVDLSAGTTSTVSTEKYRECGGGHGLGSVLFRDYCKDKTNTDGLDPKNVIVVAASRFSATMKYAGWYAIVVMGKATRPVWHLVFSCLGFLSGFCIPTTSNCIKKFSSLFAMTLFAKKFFDEKIRLPVVPCIISSVFVGILCWLFLKHVLGGPSGFFLPPWRLQVIFFVVPFLLLKFSIVTRIFYQRDHLHLRFITGGHRSGISIAPDAIISCEQVPYSCSLWNLLFPHTRRGGYLKILIPGYSSKGLFIRYNTYQLFSGETTEAVLFPVKDMENLLALLGYRDKETAKE